MQCSHKPQALNIIFIIIDSLRADSLQYMRNTNKFANNNWQFVNHISGGNATQSGLFSLFYSIPSSYWTAALKQHISPVFIDLLLEYGYKTKVIASAEFKNPPLHKTIYQKIPNLHLGGEVDKNISHWDINSTKEAVKFLKRAQNKQPFFLNIFYNAPHAFCNGYDFPMKYKPVMRKCSRLNMHNDSPATPYYNSYLNTLDFIDKEISVVFNHLKTLGYLQNSIVVITSDHGQEFNDNHKNYWGHASNYSSYQVKVPLIIHWPGENPQKFRHLTTSYDVMPTIFSKLFNCTNNYADYSVGHSLLDLNKSTNFILSGSYVNYGIIEPDRLTTLHASGEFSITDLQLNDITNATPRTKILNQALRMMRRYYD